MINRQRISFNYNHLLLLFILGVGIVLRFYDFFEIPFTHDELSAVSRLHYESFDSLIKKGVMPDGHPAGVQVFLYYYSKVFGIEAWVIKLPFLLMGVASIFLIYLIGRRWFNPSAALLAAACLATLQFPIMYSQIARPYVSGLFLCLLLVWFWTIYFSKDAHKKKLYLIGIAITAALCAYNHYFSLLFALIVGITGLFFVNRSNWKPYISAGIFALILFLPHLNIFFFQFGNKGLSWLAPPGKDFLLKHLAFIFHYSLPVYITVLSIIGIGILHIIYRWSYKELFRNWQFKLIALLWFLLPLLIGFFYSILVKPVLQYSVLIFSLPFLFLFLFSFFDIRNNLLLSAAILVLSAVNIYTLIYEREHYQLKYEQVYNESPKHIKNILATIPENDIKLITGEESYFLKYYFDRSDLNMSIFSINDSDMGTERFSEYLAELDENHVIAINLPLEHMAAAREHYPYPVYIKKGFLFELYGLSREKHDTLINDIIFNRQLLNEEGDDVFEIKVGEEWGPGINILLDTLEMDYYSIVDIAVDVKVADPHKKGLIVWQLLKNEETIGWRTINTTSKDDEWNRYYLSNRLLHELNDNDEMKGVVMKIYYWNIDKSAATVKDFRVSLREGNRKIYGLYYKF